MGGTDAAVLDGITGLRVGDESLEAVTNALQRLLNDAQLAKRLGEQGRHLTVENFSWAQVAHQTDLLHQDMQRNNRLFPAKITRSRSKE